MCGVWLASAGKVTSSWSVNCVKVEWILVLNAVSPCS